MHLVANRIGDDGRVHEGPHLPAIVCVTGQASVTQSDGSTELKVRVMITDKDPNEFNVTTSDFKVLDSAGHDTAVDPATSDSRTGSSDCVYQQPTDTGWPVSPGASLSRSMRHSSGTGSRFLCSCHLDRITVGIGSPCRVR